jgi:hypothetical protein
MDCLLTSCYLPPVEWFTKLYGYERVWVEQYDNYEKQTYRNRCIIDSPNGPLPLSLPVEKTTEGKCLMKDIRISDHNQWRRVHWNALQSAYSESPFFEYYADDIRPFFEQKYDFLVDFNEAIRQKMCELIDIHPSVEYTQEFLPPQEVSSTTHHPIIHDFRDVISAKHPQPDADFEVKRYWQVFQRKHGFLTNLSILDLLFNMGPESIFYL